MWCVLISKGWQQCDKGLIIKGWQCDKILIVKGWQHCDKFRLEKGYYIVISYKRVTTRRDAGADGTILSPVTCFPGEHSCHILKTCYIDFLLIRLLPLLKTDLKDFYLQASCHTLKTC